MKKDETLSETFAPVKLYRDDIDNLLKSFNKLQSEIGIKIGKYEFDSIEDFNNHIEGVVEEQNTDKFHFLIIKTRNYDLHLRIYSNSASLDLYSPTPEWKGIYYEIKGQIEKKVRRINSFFNTSKKSSVLVGMIPLLLLVIFVDYLGYPVSEIYLWVLAFFLSFIGFYVFILTQIKSLIYVKYKSDRPNFYKRNKDRIWVGVITAIVTAIITVILTICLQPLFASQ